MQNGTATKVLAGCIVGLLIAAATGSWTMAQRMASLEAQISSMSANISEISARVTFLERERWKDHRE